MKGSNACAYPGALRTNALVSLFDDPTSVKDLGTVALPSGDCPHP
jgi:hypothetical protein